MPSCNVYPVIKCRS